MNEPNHFRRIVVIWVIASVIATPLVVFLLCPNLPPGNGSVQASGQVTDNTVLFGVSTPIALAVLVYFGYVLVVFRDREPASEAPADGPSIRGHAQVQLWWIGVTTIIVLFLAAYGTIRMLEDGSGGGQGPDPIATPAAAKTGHVLQVQVIAQQWRFTYRWPSYGGVETASLELPANTDVEFHVTSVDAIHSFWAYQLGVKADANPGADNIAHVQTKGPMRFDIHCAELCGVWHGYMFDTGTIVPSAQFASWIQQRRQQFAPATKALPPFSKTYFPDPQRRGG
jgi:cytochrome c oxidase subunit II